MLGYKMLWWFDAGLFMFYCCMMLAGLVFIFSGGLFISGGFVCSGVLVCFDLVLVLMFCCFDGFLIFWGFLFFDFLMLFGGFFDFSLIFFLGFCFAFTHQNGYNFGNSLAIHFFWSILAGVDEVTRNKSPRKVYGFASGI